ncbi:InlB B-repeat-containing protein [Agathobacter sp.]|uniref:InlB B-repeat-containing protein n=1 Tax=Agathobacter sp. TaxID=2021311 RepID=UPI003FD7CA6B
MNKIKRIMAVMLALVMVLAIAPAQSAWAEGEQQENQQPGEPQQGEQPGPARGIELRVEGDAAGTDTLAELVMVSLDNGANYKSLNELASDANSKVQKKGSSYEFDSAVTSIMAYLTDAAGSYMLQTPVQIGKNNAVKINAGQTFIQIDKVRYTVTWAYDAKRYGEDAYLEHGTAKIIKVGDKTDFTDWDMFANNPGNKDGGNLVVEPGQQVTIELVPDYGYQLAGVSLNGNTLAPQENISTYTFTMPQTSVHFKGAFVKADDVTDVSSAAVGKIEISDGDNAAASGNLKIDVSDSASDTAKANEQIAATDGVKKEVVANLDISLQNIVSKGTNMQEISADNYWVNDITEFEKPIRLDVAIKDFDKDSEYSVVREHNGSYDVLDATVSDGKISFETNKFSTYVIVKKTAVKAVVINPDTIAKPQEDKKPADIKTTDKTVDKAADNAGNATKSENIKNEKAAKTDDNLNVSLMLGMLLIGAVAVAFSFRKKSL